MKIGKYDHGSGFSAAEDLLNGNWKVIDSKIS